MTAALSAGIDWNIIRRFNKMSKIKKLIYVEITLNSDDMERLNLGRHIQISSNGVEYTIDLDG